MNIEIDDTKTIKEISEAFSKYFPFLKLEFYSEPHNWQERSTAKYLLDPDKKIGEIRTRHNPASMEIRPWDNTGEVEQGFKRHFGLNAQIFRHHGDVWVQTAGTDVLTLDEQNEIGRNTTQDKVQGPDSRFEREKPL
jgi:hypothetical protein